ncbi:hypothetical protein PMAYCL1PPCAC_12431 [Pristionchus mayeri]|uniref:Uncharacterized protein n=1 Tax=Pristionchus mayeri TaxID=1317129 RepID=A0AAN4ZNL9_9BILA|nr:hypothetical protein PMAYCL1PPCAC_12431 [Pristionchus mayeri]
MNNSSYMHHEPRTLDLVGNFLKKLDLPSANKEDLFERRTTECMGLNSIIDRISSNSSTTEQNIERNKKDCYSCARDIVKYEEEKENLTRRLNIAKSELSKWTKKREDEELVIETCIKEKNFMEDHRVKAIKHSDSSSSIANDGYKGIEFL